MAMCSLAQSGLVSADRDSVRDIKTRLIDSQPEAAASTTGGLAGDKRSGVDVNKQGGGNQSSGGCC